MPIKYTKEILEEAVKNSINFTQVLRYLNLAIAGGNASNIKNRIKKYGIDVSHFLGKSSTKGKDPAIKISSVEDGKNRFFIRDKLIRGSLLKSVINRLNIIEYKCFICGLKNTWNDKELNLEIHHLNEDHLDNRLENLRYICPNCHSQLGNRRKKAPMV